MQQQASVFFDAVRDLLGTRLAETNIDSDHHLSVTVTDLLPSDTTSIGEIAHRNGVAKRVRVEAAAPSHVATWERLRADLLRLADVRPRVLQSWPTPTAEYRHPPLEIVFEAHAEAEAHAQALLAEYGAFVSLRVGALPYPLPVGAGPADTNWWDHERTRADVAEMRFALDGPLIIRRGETVLHDLLVTNIGSRRLGFGTNGKIIGKIVDPESGQTFGGFCGPQPMPYVEFTAAPSQTVRIPLLVGTASFRPELGYAIPPGRWHAVAPMDLVDGRHLISAALDLTVIS